MKFIISSLLVFLHVAVAFSQPFEGKITFSIDFPGMQDPQTKAMLPTEAVSYFKNKKSRMEMTMMMGMTNTTISDADAGTAVILMDMMGQKYAVSTDKAATDKESKELESKAKVSVSNETKVIAGYTCKKAIIEFPSEKNPKEMSKMTVWFTKEIDLTKGYVKGPMGKIDGSVLEFSMNEGPMAMVLSAKDVVKVKVADDKFVVPDGYKKVTQDELKQMMGGGR
jgi:GLPGLI family protein